MNPAASLRLSALLLVTTAAASAADLGYRDTPMLPDSQWRVHDADRPRPRIIKPAPTFSLLAPPPSDAVVLFDGKDLSKWESTRGNGNPARWTVADGAFQVAPRTGGIRTKDKFVDFQLHLEFATPAQVQGESQGRGNSGVLINGMYEVQILDSYENPTYADGQAGAIYGQTPPLVNAAKPPGEWQSYDIIFESPRWDAEGKLTKKANVTVIHNGAVLHHRQELIGATDGVGGVPHKALSAYLKPHAPEVFIELQDHSNPTRFRNIWIRELREREAAK